jgi:hypothetical protein
MRTIGSQTRQELEYSDYKMHQRINAEEVILMAYDGVLQLWVANDDYAGFVLEIDGVGYEFVTSVNAEDIHRLLDTNN